ncbi:ATP-dependent DNA helicase [Candidatus Woesearchaeota archaeon]|nr:ATP-dependent DNA helicase [Candidatus Woesearchaeota archaeon]
MNLIEEYYFPHENLRKEQDQLIKAISKSVNSGSDLLVNAPTGLGKTSASLGPALKFAVEKGKKVLFLTSRHTQHELAMQTAALIKEKFNKSIVAVDIIGRKWLCLQPGVTNLYANEFAEYCKAMKEDELCDYYKALREGDHYSRATKAALDSLKAMPVVETNSLIGEGKKWGVCPYELSLFIAKQAHLIVADYFYVFNPSIMETFMKRAEIALEDCIIVVDEAHNLPDRVKELSTARLTTIMLQRAAAEAKKNDRDDLAQAMSHIVDIFESHPVDEETYMLKGEFIENVSKFREYTELIDDLEELADKVREEQQMSYLGSVAGFLRAWEGSDEGFTRILSSREGYKEDLRILSYRCLDPSIITAGVINNAHCTVMMSGTLTPTEMYKDILGMSRAEELTLKSPFPDKNRLNIIVPKTSTKFTERSEQQYKNIADILGRILGVVPGNVAIFFPSYQLRDDIQKFVKTSKTLFTEDGRMSKGEKQEFLNKYRSYKETGAVLMGVVSGNFGEGIDLPGDELQCVVIVGLPLQRPDLETNALINYYEKKFSNGWDYGYLFPAFTRTLQSAGRCIRSENDKGVILFVDERYNRPNYRRCFPAEWDIKVTVLYEGMIKKFFEENGKTASAQQKLGQR